jgi:FtsZ-binding cell division protein ZapB
MEKSAEIAILKEKTISLEARVSEADKNREIMARQIAFINTQPT